MNIPKQFTALLLALNLFTGCSTEPQPQKPNIVLIMADDMGYSDIGCFGSEINTPNLDRLAEEGIRMTQFYNAARCCPSRASLLTGLYQHQAGMGDMNYNYEIPAYQGYLNQNSVTIAELLKTAGYSTFISGKWHVGDRPGQLPTDRGFEKQYGSNTVTGHYFGIIKNRRFIVEGKDSIVPGEWIRSNNVEYKIMKNGDGSQWYATDAFTDRAIGYIKEHRQKEAGDPFFIYLPYTAPHWPLHAFKEDIAKYSGTYLVGWDSIRHRRFNRMKEMGILGTGWELSKRNFIVPSWDSVPGSVSPDPWVNKGYESLGGEYAFWDAWMSVYAAMIDRMDQNIGRLMEALNEAGYDENTLVIFLSDNGASPEAARKGDPAATPGSPHSFAGYSYPWANASNTPFNWYKKYTHEGGISTPFIAWMPGKIPGGKINHQMAHITDIMPTCLDLAGITYPAGYNGNELIPLEGQSIKPLLFGEPMETRDTLYWEHEGNRAIRAGKWKLVFRTDLQSGETLSWSLYDMELDRTETVNLAKKYPGKVEELDAAWNNWADRVGVVDYLWLRGK